MDIHELKGKTVNELRELAASQGIEGVSGKKKDDLLEILAEKLGLDLHAHVPEGIGRRRIKARLRELRARRAKALAERNRAALIDTRREIHAQKHRLRQLIRRALRASEAAKAPPAGGTPAA
jgi:hypothetical protein